MTTVTNNGEGGTDTTTVTTGNSGGTSGTAFSTVSIGASSTCKFSATQSAHGSLSYQFVTAASAFDLVALTQTSSATTAVRFYIYTTTSFTTATTIMQVLTTANANIAQVQLNTANKLVMQQTSGGIFTSTTALSINTWYRVECTINTTTGAWTFAYYSGDSTTATESSSGTGTFTATPVNVRFGKASNGAQVATFYMDDLAISDTATSFLGPAAGVTGSASLSGGGALSTTGVPAIAGAASFSADGALAGYSNVVTGSAALSATGVLAQGISAVLRPQIIGTPTSAFSATATASLTISKPSGVQDNDLLVAVLRGQSNSATTDWALAGWTRRTAAFVASDGSRVHGIFTKAIPVAASESATSYTFVHGTGNSNRTVGAMFIVRHADLTEFAGSSATYAPTTLTNGATLDAITLHETTALFIAAFAAETVSPAVNGPVTSPSGLTNVVNLSTDTVTTTTRTQLSIWQQDVDASTASEGQTWTSGTVTGPSADGLVIRGLGVQSEPHSGTAAFAGGGVLAGSGTAGSGYSGSAALSGGGTLTAAGTPAVAPTVALSASGTLVIHGQTPVERWLAGARYAAHRGGSADWAEETLYSYGQATNWNADAAMEISLWQSSDGIWVASHDQTTGRVFSGTSLDIPTNTWATLSSKVTISGGKPIAKVTDILDAYATDNRVFLVDNKGNQNSSAFYTMLATYGGSARFIIKAYGISTTIPNTAATNGYQSWGYFYPADTSNLPTYAPLWSLLGEDVLTATSTDWTAIKSYGKLVLGHIIATAAQKATAITLGADGFMVSGVTEVIPQTPVAIPLSGTGTLAATGVVSYPGTAAFSGGGTLTTTGVPAMVGAAGYSAAGTLSQTAVPSPAATIALSGAGTLTTTATPSPAQTAGLSGTGVLNATASGTVPGSAGLSGTGVLGATGTPAIGGSAALSAVGSLGFSGTPAIAVSSPLSAAGSLTAAPVVGLVGSAGFAGGGTLTTTAPTNFVGSAGFDASGTLSQTAVATPKQSIALSGLGVLSATGIATFERTAVFIADGTLTAVGKPQMTAPMVLSATGVLVGNAPSNFVGSASLGGTGTLAASGVMGYARQASFAGSGQLAANGAPGFTGAANLAGAGTLTLLGIPGYIGSAGLSGGGTLTVISHPGILQSIALGGIGVLDGQKAAARDVIVTATMRKKRWNAMMREATNG